MGYRREFMLRSVSQPSTDSHQKINSLLDTGHAPHWGRGQTRTVFEIILRNMKGDRRLLWHCSTFTDSVALLRQSPPAVPPEIPGNTTYIRERVFIRPLTQQMSDRAAGWTRLYSYSAILSPDLWPKHQRSRWKGRIAGSLRPLFRGMSHRHPHIIPPWGYATSITSLPDNLSHNHPPGRVCCMLTTNVLFARGFQNHPISRRSHVSCGRRREEKVPQFAQRRLDKILGLFTSGCALPDRVGGGFTGCGWLLATLPCSNSPPALHKKILFSYIHNSAYIYIYIFFLEWKIWGFF